MHTHQTKYAEKLIQPPKQLLTSFGPKQRRKLEIKLVSIEKNKFQIISCVQCSDEEQVKQRNKLEKKLGSIAKNKLICSRISSKMVHSLNFLVGSVQQHESIKSSRRLVAVRSSTATAKHRGPEILKMAKRRA